MGGEHRVRFEVVVIETDRQRVYAATYFRITMSDGRTWIGDGRWSPISALHDVARQIEAEGGTMMCMGLDPRFYETGLLSGTGYGYLDQHGEAHYMMERWADGSHTG